MLTLQTLLQIYNNFMLLKIKYKINWMLLFITIVLPLINSQILKTCDGRNCDLKLQGCLQHSNNICTSCQDKYYLEQSTGLCKLTIAAVQEEFSPFYQVEEIGNITDYIEVTFGSCMRTLHEFNKKNHPHLRQFEIIRGQRRGTSYGAVGVFYYEKKRSGELILVTASVNCQGTHTELYYEAKSRLDQEDPFKYVDIFLGDNPGWEFIYLGGQTNGFGSMPIFIRSTDGNIQFSTIDGIKQRRYQRGEISDLAFLALIKKYKGQNLGFDLEKYDRIIRYESATVFVYGIVSVSVIYEECTFIVNDFVYEEGEAVYNYDEGFFTSYQFVKPRSIIANLPSISRVFILSTIEGNAYVITYDILNLQNGEILLFTIRMIKPENGAPPSIVSYSINDEIFTKELEDIVNQIGGSVSDCLLSDGDQCRQCQENYQLIQGKCQPLSPSLPNCLTSNLGRCERCEQNYTLIQGRCEVATLPNLPNCRIRNFQGCLICEENYHNDAGKCVTVDNICIKFDSGRCSQCKRGFRNWDGKCLALFCEVFTEDGKCSSCQPRYGLKEDGTCEEGYTAFCKTQAFFGCLECIKGYVLAGDQCLQQIPGCISYDQYGCFRCEGGNSPVRQKCR